MDTTNRIKHRNQGFTLVELLVVITIIGILAALITVAAVGALKKANETRTKVEIDQMASGIDEYKNKTTAYPPNCQTDDKTIGGTSGPLDEVGIFNDIKRHMRQAYPRSQESDSLLLALIGTALPGASAPADAANYPPLNGGMTAGEALVFWLGGFSTDPKYPISGEGGPSYEISGQNNPDSRKQDPIETRKWVYPFQIERLGPRNASDGYFDESSSRYVEYQDPKGKWRRINFWQYKPAKSEQPYLYFDTSRHPAGVLNGSKLYGPYDPPAATTTSKVGLNVFAFKKLNPSYSPTNAATTPVITYVNPDKFQIIHSGLDDRWDADDLKGLPLRSATISPTTGLISGAGNANTADTYITFPAGPFTGDIADAIVNFITQTRIEDAPKP